LGNLPGLEDVIPLASGGVQTTAVDGDTIWAVTALANELQKISAALSTVETTYQIDAYVEGVIVGGGYVWLLSYDNGGEVLRFDPEAEQIDLRVPLGGQPWYGAFWFVDRLWVSNDQGQILEIAIDGEILATETGEIKGQGLGYHWLNDPETGLITSLAGDGARGEVVIPTDGTVTSDGSGIRSVTEAGGYLWLMEGDFPNGSTVTRYDPATGTLQPLSVTAGLLGMSAFEDALWVTSNIDEVLVRIDPNSGEKIVYPLPGKPGGVFEAAGDLWVVLYHPGALIRIATDADLIRQGEVAVDNIDNGHRLLCTGPVDSGRPTVLLEPSEWVDYGSWSVVQAQISAHGYLVCASGYLEGDVSPEQRSADLKTALDSSGIAGPYLLVGNSDGVHAVRFFAEGRGDIAGVVLVAPMPVGFPDFYDELMGQDLGPKGGHPPWADLDTETPHRLGTLGDIPLVVVDQDELFLTPQFVDFAGGDRAAEIAEYWRRGVDFYAGLSANTTRIVSPDTGFNQVLWDSPDLITEQILGLLERIGDGG
jgi:sugar lactone lactonase YvrE